MNKDKNIIVRKDNRSSFVTSSNAYFRIGKNLFNFVSYDKEKEKGNRMNIRIPITPSFEATQRIIYDFVGSQSMIKILANDVKAAKSKGEKYAALRTLYQGGNGEGTISRLLKVQGNMGNDKYPIVFRAEQCPGKRDEKGLIIPDYKSGKLEAVSIIMTYEDVKEFLLQTKAEMDAFLSARYLKEWDEIFAYNGFEN